MIKLRYFIVGLIFWSTAASAATFEINPYSRGCMNSLGNFACSDSGTASGNYVTGTVLGSTRRSFFLFDLSSVHGPIISASLSFQLHGLSYRSIDSSEGLGFFQLSSASITKIESSNGDASTFSDLGTGINLGYPSFTAAMAGTTVSNSLSNLWLNALNATGAGKFAIGGSLITPDGYTSESVLGNSGSTEVKLTLVTGKPAVVPLPASIPLLVSGLVGLGLLRRRQQS